ncbi:MAG: DUF262 domain-containing protein [Zoogloeaceae bacterium]|jgi:hypothetical protein|nr:DUF262 domain-containing protein [Zoogloeaceae bacterium]
MSGGSTFKTNPVALSELLKDCRDGVLQLPDFQRSWVWDEDRIKSLIASISRAFPIGALMTLETGGETNFKPRPVEGASPAVEERPSSLLLDGQQRMTSLYQVTLRGEVVKTKTAKGKDVERWFYIDIRKALEASEDRDDAIVGVPRDLLLKGGFFGRDVVLDLSSPEREYETLMYPVRYVFDWDEWQDGFDDFWRRKPDGEEMRSLFRRFKKKVLENFKSYDVPVITLGRATSKEAVCVVFEKVNTGGKPLDAFELVTAMYAAEGHELRKDWYGDGKGAPGRHQRFRDALIKPSGADSGILAGVGNTDFLQVISLFHTRERRREAEKAGKQGKELPNVTGNRQALLSLPLSAYKQYERQVEEGFMTVAKFLHTLHIYRIGDLPYQSQIVPLAAILADIGDDWGNLACRDKLQRWFWNGVFGELYGSSVDTRNARDFMEVPAWLRGGEAPSTISETLFRADRLKTMRSRLSAAYKGMNALLMDKGAKDFCSGQKFDDTVFFGENVDIHHIFPKAWCLGKGIRPEVFDSIINKTPLSYRTNRVIGGVAPSEYLARLKTAGMTDASLDENLRSHLIDPELLRADRFEDFLVSRQRCLLDLIREAGVQVADMDGIYDDDEGTANDDDDIEASRTVV